MSAPGLWRDTDFRRFWAGQTASQLGEQAGQVTLPLIAVLALNAGATQLGVLRAVEQAPILLLSLFAGAWVDRRRTRPVMMLADLGRALALSTIPVLMAINFVFGALTPLGSLLGGCLAGWWGLRMSLLLTAAALTLSPLVMALSPLARLGKDLPAEPGPSGGPIRRPAGSR
jgi:hypothetical protein